MRETERERKNYVLEIEVKVREFHESYGGEHLRNLPFQQKFFVLILPFL